MDYTHRVPDRIELYVFDLDGTLVDSLVDLTISVNWILSEYGFPEIDAETVRRGVGNGARNLLARSFAAAARIAGIESPREGVPEGALARYGAHYEARCADNARLYPGIREWLSALSLGGRRMAVLSNKGESASGRLLESLGVSDCFGVIAGPETFGALKPDPAGFRAIAERFGVPTDRAVMVGDSAVDVQTGRNAGALACGITGGLGDDAALRASLPDILIERSLANA